jgi:hypothetical protein
MDVREQKLHEGPLLSIVLRLFNVVFAHTGGNREVTAVKAIATGMEAMELLA